MNILAIGAHPDDLEFGIGGTLLKYSKKHDSNIFLLVMTDGSASGDPTIRKREQEKVAEALNVKKIIWGGFEDTELAPNKNTISFIEGIINSVNPDEIYVNYNKDMHQDHRVLAQSVISATRYKTKVLFYECLTSCNFAPDIFVNIEDVLEQKIELLRKHKSQVNKNYPCGLNLEESLNAMANFRGFQGKVRYAEGLKAHRFLKEV